MHETHRKVKVNRLTTKSRPRKPIQIVANGKTYTVYQSRFIIGRTAILISDYMSAKMEGFPSISTACTMNKFCLARLKRKIGICAKCFAYAKLKFKKNLAENLRKNYEILTKEVLPSEVLPTFCDDVEQCRIESFGDIETIEQAINYINIMLKNPKVQFAWWSKNEGIRSKAIAKCGKPANCVCVYSSPFVNVEVSIESLRAKGWSYIDKVFTVFDKEYAAKNNICINCGARACKFGRGCGNCYRCGGDVYVRELLK